MTATITQRTISTTDITTIPAVYLALATELVGRGYSTVGVTNYGPATNAWTVTIDGDDGQRWVFATEADYWAVGIEFDGEAAGETNLSWEGDYVRSTAPVARVTDAIMAMIEGNGI